MAAMLLMLLPPKLIPTFVTRHTLTLMIWTKTSLTWWPPASATHDAQLHTACTLEVSSSAGLVIVSHCSQTQLSLLKKVNQSYSLSAMMVLSTGTTPFSYHHGGLMSTCSTVCLDTRSLNTVPSTPPRVSLAPRPSRRSTQP